MEVNIVLVIIFCIVASVVQACSGLGYTIVMMGLMPLIMPYRSANLVTLISAIAVLITAIIKLREHINYRLLTVPVISSLAARFISLELVAVLPETFLLKFSGVFLICIAVYIAFFSQKIALKPTRLNGGIIGFFAGLFGGLTNISGPIFVIYFLPASKTNAEYSATLQLSFLIGCIFTLGLNAIRGNITTDLLRIGFLGGMGAIAGMIAGLQLFKKINRVMLKRILCVLIVLMGCMQLF